MHGNIGKPRSKFGKFLDANRITQDEIVKESGVNKDTVSRACSAKGEPIRGISQKRLVDAARKLSKKPVYEDDFWT